jgi:hypothetical protein
VGLDEGVHAEPLRLGQQLRGEGVVDHGEDDQDAVGAQRPALGHLPGIDEEVLAQAGQGDGVAGGGEEGGIALEAGAVGQDRQAACAAALVVADRAADLAEGAAQAAAVIDDGRAARALADLVEATNTVIDEDPA